MKAKIKYIIYAAAALALAVSFTLAVTTTGHNRSLKRQVQEQSRTIDSLLTIQRQSLNIQLYVTDKSTNKIYGRYNRGTIQMPSEKVYLLEIDSAQFGLK